MITGKDVYPEGMVSPAPKKGGSYEDAPIGVYMAVLAMILDLGIRTTKFGDKPQIKFIWLTQRTDSEGKPYMIWGQSMTLSSHKKSALFIALSDWGIQPLRFEENGSWAVDFLPSFIGQLATLNITHAAKDDGEGVWVNVASISPPMDGMVFTPPENDERIAKLVENIKRNGGIWIKEERQDAPAHTDADAPNDIQDTPIPF